MRSNNHDRVARQALLAALLVLTSGALAATARAQDPVGAGIKPKPVVMLLVDTSGSMERMPNTDTRIDALPDCSTAEKNRWAITLESLTGTFAGFNCTEEDRSTYSTSEYDYGYFLPHYRPSFTSQTPTGLLDIYEKRAKFGLMTFDPIATYVGGPVFVAYDVLDLDPANEGASGMYSYGGVKELVFPGCTQAYGVDNGIRNADAPSGALISPGSSENAPDVAAVNQAIQEALLGTADASYTDGVRPFGGTPVAAMLSDLKWFFDNDAELSLDNDPYAECRDRTAILITDGVPDSDFRDERFECDTDPDFCDTEEEAGKPCTCPYEEPVDYVDELCEAIDGQCDPKAILNSGFHVVALSLSADEEALTLLDALALAGGTEEARLADTASDLDEALSEIVDAAAREATTRVSPVVRVSSFGQLYELTAGFRIPDGGGTWQGVLERQRYGCGDDDLTPEAIPLENETGTGTPKDILHEHLDDSLSLTERNIVLFTVPQGHAYDFIRSQEVDASDAYAGTTLNRNDVNDFDEPIDSDDGSGNSGFGDPLPNEVQLTRTELNNVASVSEALQTMLGFDASSGSTSNSLELTSGLTDLNDDSTVDGDDAVHAYQWLAGEDGSRESKLGAIYHSQPAVVSPPEPDTANDNLNAFYRALANQPEAVIVATGDGLLHAFALDTDTVPKLTADEVRPYAEQFDLDEDDLVIESDVEPGDELWAIAPPAALASLPDAVSGTQLLFDGSPIVRTVATKRAAGTDDPTSFRRVMIAALRGLPAFVAFDITNITKPKFLWQFTHPKLGETVGQPVLTQLAVKWNDNEVYERSIALLPAGSGETDSECDGGGVAGSRHHDEETDLADQMITGMPRRDAHDDAFRCWRQVGRALFAIDVMTGSLVQHFDHNFFAAPLTGGMALDVDGLGLTATAGYISDEEGILYRIDLSSNDPEDWFVEAVYDVFHEAPPGSDDPATYGGRPVIYPPVIRQLEGGRQVIVLATGDVDNLTDSIRHRVVSLVEERNFGDEASSVSLEENWSIMLDPKESVTGSLVYFNETVYFTSFIPSPVDQPCFVGASRIWGVDYLEEDPENAGEPLGMLPNLAEEDGEDVTHYDETVVPELADNLLVGVSITQQPTCTPAPYETDPYLGQRRVPSGQVAGGGFSLRAVTNGGGGTKQPGSSMSQIEVGIHQPARPLTRVRGGFGSALE